MRCGARCFHLVQSGVTSVQDTDTGGDGDTAHVLKHLGPRDWAGTRGRYSEADYYIETMAKGVAEELAGYDRAETFTCCGKPGRIASHGPFLPRHRTSHCRALPVGRGSGNGRLDPSPTA
jgi:hypothetical protein